MPFFLAMVILLNTFASQIICALALPLLHVLNKPIITNPDPDVQQPHSNHDTEIDIVENKSRSFYDLCRINMVYIGLLMLKVLYAICLQMFSFD